MNHVSRLMIVLRKDLNSVVTLHCCSTIEFEYTVPILKFWDLAYNIGQMFEIVMNLGDSHAVSPFSNSSAPTRSFKTSDIPSKCCTYRQRKLHAHVNNWRKPAWHHRVQHLLLKFNYKTIQKLKKRRCSRGLETTSFKHSRFKEGIEIFGNSHIGMT